MYTFSKCNRFSPVIGVRFYSISWPIRRFKSFIVFSSTQFTSNFEQFIQMHSLKKILLSVTHLPF